MTEIPSSDNVFIRPGKILLLLLFSLVLVSPAVYFVALRESWVGTDTQNYIFFFQRAEVCGCIPEEMEFLFGLVAWFVGSIGGGEEVFFGIISAIQFFLAVVLAISLGRYLEYKNSTFAFCLFFISLLLVFPFFLSMQVNVLRQGVSALFVANAAIFFQQRKRLLFISFCLLAIGFHYSALMYVATIPILCLSYKRIKWIFIFLIVFYITGLSEQFVRVISEGLGLPLYQFLSDYGSDSDYRSGVRLDFIVFSVFPLLLLGGLGKIQFTDLGAARLQKIASVYLVLMVPFLVLGWGSYSDRYALGAWLLIPVFATVALMRFVGYKFRWMSIYCVLAALCSFALQMNSGQLWQ